MPKRRIEVLCVHGVGRHIPGSGWHEDWKWTIGSAIRAWNPDAECEFEVFEYDSFFEKADLNPLTYAAALAKLTGSLAWHGLGDLFGARGAARGDLSGHLRWSAGMVAQWASDDKLRDQLCKALTKKMNNFFTKGAEKIVVAHSLGSLVTYDAFRRDQSLVAGARYVTLGSQIGNPAVRSTFGGMIAPLPTAAHWHHLFNRHDDVLTARLDVREGNFTQVDAAFNVDGIADHDAVMYLGHAGTRDTVWREAAMGLSDRRSLAGFSRTLREAAQPKRSAKKRLPDAPRALLVGINDYPDPASRLEGCVNDVFRMSEVLQESGVNAEQIRVVLNDRATSGVVLDRLRWLLDGAENGGARIFYYSGHGAQIPAYDADETIDSKDECLVTYDFDWTREHSVTDNQFCEMYSQLPYSANFFTILDCCHSGGMTRDSGLRVRGLSPPDDIRHRGLRWEWKPSARGKPPLNMWVGRDLKLGKGSQSLFRKDEADKRVAEFLGANKDVRKLGRATSLWMDERRFKKTTADLGHHGPYMPVIVQACQESQFAYEYRHGVTSFGAFTYCFTQMLRDARANKRKVTFESLVRDVGKRLKDLEYDQTPALAGPRIKTSGVVPLSFGR